MPVNTPYKYKFAFLYDWLTPCYDLVKTLGIRRRLHQKIFQRVIFKPGEQLLDIGCGTGDDVIYLKTNYPNLIIIGADGDKRVLQIAQNKAGKVGLDIKFQVALAEKLPFRSNSFDIVWSSLMIHHLPTEFKKKAFREMYRVLKPGGRLYLIEFSRPKNFILRKILSLQNLVEPIQDHYEGKIPQYLEEVGFQNLLENKVLFHVSLIKVVK